MMWIHYSCRSLSFWKSNGVDPERRQQFSFSKKNDGAKKESLPIITVWALCGDQMGENSKISAYRWTKTRHTKSARCHSRFCQNVDIKCKRQDFLERNPTTNSWSHRTTRPYVFKKHFWPRLEQLKCAINRGEWRSNNSIHLLLAANIVGAFDSSSFGVSTLSKPFSGTSFCWKCRDVLCDDERGTSLRYNSQDNQMIERHDVCLFWGDCNCFVDWWTMS